MKTQSFETPDKAQAFFVAGMNLNLRDDDPDYPALVFGNYMLGGGFLNSRLVARIRVKEGLSYGVGSQLNAAPLDKSGGFLAYRHLRAAEPREAGAGVQGGDDARAEGGLHRRRDREGQVRLAAEPRRRRVRRTASSWATCSTTCSSAAPLPGTRTSRRR